MPLPSRRCHQAQPDSGGNGRSVGDAVRSPAGRAVGRWPSFGAARAFLACQKSRIKPVAITASAITPPQPAVHRAASKSRFDSQQRAETRHQLHVSSAHSAQQIKNQEHARARQRAEQRRSRATPAMLRRLQNHDRWRRPSQESNWRSGDASDRRYTPRSRPLPPIMACAVTGRPPCQTVCPVPAPGPASPRIRRFPTTPHSGFRGAFSKSVRSKQQRCKKSGLQRKFRQRLTRGQTPASRIQPLDRHLGHA